MQTVTKLITHQGLADRCFKASQLNQLIVGSAKRRYALVSRAIKSGEVLQIQRGLYILADRYRSQPCHPFALAQALVSGSYISFETALTYHGWIPERVYSTASAVPGRKSSKYENKKFGTYNFHPLATQSGYFLELVSRVQTDDQTMLIAQPCRALMDLICLRKVAWKGLHWLTDGLRIDPHHLNTITRDEIIILKQVYKHKKVKTFLTALSLELNID